MRAAFKSVYQRRKKGTIKMIEKINKRKINKAAARFPFWIVKF